MKLLILGGTDFVGRIAVEHALSLQWDVTVLNRGTANSDPRVTALRGDRREPGGIDALQQGDWDMVFDTWSSDPSAVEHSAALLSDRVGRYIYVSSRSVYDAPAFGATEEWPVVKGIGKDYPHQKSGGERAVVHAFGDRALLLRAGLILGPYENIGRLTWWLSRIQRGGVVLAPGPRDLPLQYIDARDLVEWGLDAAVRGLGGAFDTVSESGHATMGDVLRCCVEVTGSNARLQWTEPDAILLAGVQPWTDLPIWIPPGVDHDSLHGSDVSKVVAAGLDARPIQETVADTWGWMRSLDVPLPTRSDRPAVGLARDVESQILAAAQSRR